MTFLFFSLTPQPIPIPWDVMSCLTSEKYLKHAGRVMWSSAKATCRLTEAMEFECCYDDGKTEVCTVTGLALRHMLTWKQHPQRKFIYTQKSIITTVFKVIV